MAQDTNIDNVPKQQGASDNFTGTVYIQPFAKIDNGMIARVTFEKGARTVWHTHSGEQVLYFLEGKGRVKREGEEIINAKPGDIVHIPPNTRHWHGADPDEENHMRHMAITGGNVTWLEPVPDENYKES
jgi:quercetin dioxygenase-like cupin family protein